MNILAVETSTELGSVALIQDTQVTAEKTWSREGSHSEFLTSSVLEILTEQNIQVHQIDRLAVGIGPGSFTGLRVAINFARAFSYAQKCSVYNLSSLELLAHQPSLTNFKGTVAVLQYGFRDIFYAAKFELDQGHSGQGGHGDHQKSCRVLQTPFVIQAEKIQAWVSTKDRLIGSGAKILKKHFAANWLESLNIHETDSVHPKASYFSQTLVGVQKSPNLTDWIHTIPLYLRLSEAEEKLGTFN